LYIEIMLCDAMYEKRSQYINFYKDMCLEYLVANWDKIHATNKHYEQWFAKWYDKALLKVWHSMGTDANLEDFIETSEGRKPATPTVLREELEAEILRLFEVMHPSFIRNVLKHKV